MATLLSTSLWCRVWIYCCKNENAHTGYTHICALNVFHNTLPLHSISNINVVMNLEIWTEKLSTIWPRNILTLLLSILLDCYWQRYCFVTSQHCYLDVFPFHIVLWRLSCPAAVLFRNSTKYSIQFVEGVINLATVKLRPNTSSKSSHMYEGTRVCYCGQAVSMVDLLDKEHADIDVKWYCSCLWEHLLRRQHRLFHPHQQRQCLTPSHPALHTSTCSVLVRRHTIIATDETFFLATLNVCLPSVC